MITARQRGLRIWVIGFKLITGAVEFLAGLAVLVLPTSWLDQLIFASTRGELRADPNDLVANFLRSHGPAFLANHDQPLSFVLIALGAVKLVGAVGLIKRRPWGFWLAIGLLVALLPLDFYRALADASLWTVLLLVANVVVLTILVRYRSIFLERESR
ncbi:MAG TPA: DUF2127 domain-containing protein [Actinomycetota bacterium]|nr:DUF2127 domain-containing protein [Actinomycetota bacterium]